jgi:hypothetical protein
MLFDEKNIFVEFHCILNEINLIAAIMYKISTMESGTCHKECHLELLTL